MKYYISIILLFFGSIVTAQKLKTSVMFSSGISYYSSSSSEVETNNLIINRGTDFCYSGGIREEYYFSKIFSWGIELAYINTNGDFGTPNPLSQNGIPEIYDIYKHSLSVHSIDVPILIKIRTMEEISKGLYFNFGIGISYIILSKRKIERETGYMGSTPTNITSVTKGDLTLKTKNNNSIGTLGVFGIGKNFVIKNKILLCEAKYRFDINKWTYPTVNDPVNSSFDIKRQCLLLNFGLTF